MYTIIDKLRYLFPEADPERDYAVVDEGNGAYIKEWRLSEPRPTDAELEALDTDDSFLAAVLARKNHLIDADTGKVIDKEIHSFAGLEEQIAILRDQLVHIINDLGLTPTPDFERLNDIAVAKVEEGAKKKEALNNA